MKVGVFTGREGIYWWLKWGAELSNCGSGGARASTGGS